MTRLTVLFILLFFSSNAFTQIGISGHWMTQNFPDWESGTIASASSDDIFRSAYQLGIDYRFVPFEKRIEFLPSLTYTSQKGQFDTETYDYDINSLGLHLDINFYPFDFEGDCNCPTWGKSGSLFEKGFFLGVSPGVDYIKSNATTTALGSSFEIGAEDLAYSLGIGAGVDIGLSQYVTVTPYVGARFFMPFDMQEFAQFIDSEVGTLETDGRQIEAGIRIGFHFTN